MDVVWLIADSLSYRACSLAPEGPDTTPGLARLTEEHGVNFTNAYAPGPLSPSSHAAIFTGELPSAAGMHEAHPYFKRDVPTIAERMRATHHTSLLTLNMWLSQGLDRGFDHTKDFSRQYLRFRSATDPLTFFRKHGGNESDARTFARFLLADRKPVRSFANYLSYRRSDGDLVPDRWGDTETYQFAESINDEIRRVRRETPGDRFIVVNYMDIHPPFDASQEAIERFAPETPTADLPIGVSPERHIENAEKSYAVEDMEKLYRATVWDFDRKVTPLVRELVKDDVFVVVTSDHGIWNRDTAYSENRLHVPLVVFAPGEEARTVPHTVNLRSLPRTTDEVVNGPGSDFPGVNILDVEDDQISVTEIIHHPNDVYERTGRVDVTKELDANEEVQRDLVLLKGDARVHYVAGEWETVAGTASQARALRAHGEEILERAIDVDKTAVEYDEETLQRLEDLGYS